MVQASNVEILTCEDKPSLNHMTYGFFTRNGGVSTAPYDCLNVGLGSDDEYDHIIENRRRAAQAFAKLPEENLCTLYQIHSDRVVYVDKLFAKEERPEGDAMVTDQAGIILGVLTADCGPVLFADETNRVIGAAHAGWKGAIGGVLENTVAEMLRHGANKNNIRAFIGPCIHQSSYEVDQSFKDRFIEHTKSYDIFFKASAVRAGHHQFDLPGLITHRLQQLELASISHLPLDTCQEDKKFFSYRRNTLQKIEGYGRGLSAIMLNKW